MSDLRTIINTDRDVRNIIIARQQERDEVEAYSPINYHIFLDYMGTTRSASQKLGNNPPKEENPQLKEVIRGGAAVTSDFEKEPNASHMCARIKFHTYDRQYKFIPETIS
jgi:hypothetical protein